MSKIRGISILSVSSALVLALSALVAVPAGAAANQKGIRGQGSVWCPAGVKPKPDKGGCTSSYATLSALVSSLGSVTPAGGVIWIKRGVDASASDMFIDGTVLTGLANYSLTLQGGWTGTPAGKISGTSTFSSPIYVVSWNNSVTAQNITVANDGGASGLGIVTTGNVQVNDVVSNSNEAYGVSIHSSNGAIAVSNSVFANDGFTGILTDGNSTITLFDVTAYGNANNGMEATGSADVVVNCSNFSSNGAYGIDASVLTGSLTLNGVSLAGNTSGPYTYPGTAVINPGC
jgi:hypothetical protein